MNLRMGVNRFLVDLPVFKTGVGLNPPQVGSIPSHSRHSRKART